MASRSRIPTEGNPRCRAVVLACIDFRFVEPLRRFLDDQGLTGDADLIGWPGGAAGMTTKDASSIEAALELAVALHEPSELILVAHHDCRRMGGSAAFPDQESENAMLHAALERAAEIVCGRFPSLAVRLIRIDEFGAAIPVADGCA
ncbi:MAG: carbonic anhydrase [Actinomycetota bacterium]